jgi:hypothetical protein
MPLEKPFDSTLSIDSIASSSHAMPAYRTMIVKPSISNHHTHLNCSKNLKIFKLLALTICKDLTILK